MSVGDTANITVSIKNGLNQAIHSITPSLTAGSSNVGVNFNYNRWTRSGSRWVSAPASTYSLTTADFSINVPFILTATASTDLGSSTTVTFTFAVRLTSTSTPYNVVVSKDITVLHSSTRDDVFISGIIASDEYETYDDMYASTATFDFVLPPATTSLFEPKLTLFPTGSSYSFYSARRAY